MGALRESCRGEHHPRPHRSPTPEHHRHCPDPLRHRCRLRAHRAICGGILSSQGNEILLLSFTFGSPFLYIWRLRAPENRWPDTHLSPQRFGFVQSTHPSCVYIFCLLLLLSVVLLSVVLLFVVLLFVILLLLGFFFNFVWCSAQALKDLQWLHTVDESCWMDIWLAENTVLVIN